MIKHHDWILDKSLFSWDHAGQGWVRITHRDSLAEVSTKQFPSRLPTVTLDQAAQGQDRLSAGLGPSHTRLLQALSDQCFAGSFHYATGNGQALADVFGVVHTMSLVAKVRQLGLQSFSFASLRSAAMILQHANDALGAIIIFFEQRFQSLKFGFAAGGTFTPGSITALFQVVTSMAEVHNFDTGLRWRAAGLVNFIQQAPVVFGRSTAKVTL